MCPFTPALPTWGAHAVLGNTNFTGASFSAWAGRAEDSTALSPDLLGLQEGGGHSCSHLSQEVLEDESRSEISEACQGFP